MGDCEKPTYDDTQGKTFNYCIFKIIYCQYQQLILPVAESSLLDTSTVTTAHVGLLRTSTGCAVPTLSTTLYDV